MEKLVTQLSSPGRDEGPVRDRGGTRIMEPSTRSASTEHEQRMELKLRRELGEQILALLDDPRTEDILLNPDSSLWMKRLGEGFTRVGEMSPTQAASALSTIAAWRGTVLNHQNPDPRNRTADRRQPLRRDRLAGGPQAGICDPPAPAQDLHACRLRNGRHSDDQGRSGQPAPAPAMISQARSVV